MESIRYGFIGTVPFEGFVCYNKWMNNMCERYRKIFNEESANQWKKAYEDKEDFTTMKYAGRSILVPVSKETILPRIYANLLAVPHLYEMEFILKSVQGMCRAFGAERFDRSAVIHECDLEISIPEVRPYDVLYIDYETIPYIQKYTRSHDALLADVKALTHDGSLVVVDDPIELDWSNSCTEFKDYEMPIVDAVRWLGMRTKFYRM